MNVITPKFSGFCPGNRFAELSLQQLKKDWPHKDILIVRDLIHNEQYSVKMTESGYRTVPSADDVSGGIAVIGTHGTERKTLKKLRKKYDALDLTCSKIKHLQNYVNYYSENGFFTVITGEENHPEVTGLVSYAGDSTIIGSDGDLERFMDDYREGRGVIAVKAYCKILVLTQTTGKRGLFEKTAKAIQSECGQSCEVKILDSLCSYNTLREEETLRLLKSAGAAIVIGETVSSNTMRLYETVKQAGTETFLVKNLAELVKTVPDPRRYGNVLAVASSSTPDFIEKEVVEYLSKL